MASPDQTPALEPAEEGQTLAPDTISPEAEKTLTPEEQGNGPSLEGNVDSSSGGGAGFSGPEEESFKNALARADELFEKGSKAIEDGDFVEAVDCLSRALEIRVAHYGELSQECASAYYKYGCALLYKAQEEADPLGNIPKNTPTNLENDKTRSNVKNSGSSKDSASDAKEDVPCGNNEEAGEDGSDKDQEDGNEGREGDGEDLAEADEDDSDLDLAWKMLDVARAIVEKRPEASLEKVNILAALGEVSMEREDIETSLSDYQKALSILEHLVEPDNRRIVELNFRICLVLEIGSKIEEAIPYCEKAISLCKSRVQRLKENAMKSTDAAGTNGDPMSDADKSGNCASATTSRLSNLEEEMDFLGGIMTELEKKLEDLQQIKSNPSSIVSEVMKAFASKSTSGNDGVTHLGVVGRGIKRATVSPAGAEPSPKKPILDSSSEKADSNSPSEDRATNLISERVGESSSSDATSQVEAQVLAELMGPERYGRVRGYGIGVTPTQLSAVGTYTRNAKESSDTAEVRQLKTTIEELKKNQENLQSQLTNISSLLQRFLPSQTPEASNVRRDDDDGAESRP